MSALVWLNDSHITTRPNRQSSRELNLTGQFRVACFSNDDQACWLSQAWIQLWRKNSPGR